MTQASSGTDIAHATKVHALHCGGDVADLASLDPFDPDVGNKVYTPYFMYVVEHPQGRVLFDTGVHAELVADPGARLGNAAEAFDVRVEEADTVGPCLARLGLTPADIDVVIQSHLHFDHAGGVSQFGHAPVLVQADELDFALSPPVYQAALYVQDDFGGTVNWQKLDGDHDVFGDGALLVLRTPGHTRGHQSLLVKLASTNLILLADATYSLEKMRARLLPGVLWSPDETVASWERLELLEAEYNAVLIPTHEVQFRERIRLAPAAHYA